ncbi:hypothetical protein DICPUDRAFT_24069, partial [Dictyostelium purpureum]
SKFSKHFRLYIDASDVGMGWMIAQDDDEGNGKPILYDSKKFDKFQKNYSTADREF